MRQITAALIGAGLRGGRVYSAYALEHPEELKIVAVAEPDGEKRARFACEHKIPEDMQFASYEELLEREKLADCVMVCTQDRMHYKPVEGAMKKGYHVLCEKPMSCDAKEIMEMGEMPQKYGKVLSICHVLRYSLFFMKIKEMLEEGRIGKLMNIQHIEQVGYWHHAHSFVRGNWRREEETSPMILQKCCHDMDILLWLAGSPCKSISSFGGLSYFTKANAPENAAGRCTDGCAYAKRCAFYAPGFYMAHPKAVEDGLVYALSPQADPAEEEGREAVKKALEEGPYGRCVFHCDNTVVDHQVVNLMFENGVQVSFTMSAFTDSCAREIFLMGTEGQIRGNMEKGTLEYTHFLSGKTEPIDLHTPSALHSGSDMLMMKDFVRLIASAEGEDGGGGTKAAGCRRASSGAAESVDGHLMALAAESSRVTGKTVDFSEYKDGMRRALGN